jgi:hypothetical protein
MHGVVCLGKMFYAFFSRGVLAVVYRTKTVQLSISFGQELGASLSSNNSKRQVTPTLKKFLDESYLTPAIKGKVFSGI